MVPVWTSLPILCSGRFGVFVAETINEMHIHILNIFKYFCHVFVSIPIRITITNMSQKIAHLPAVNNSRTPDIKRTNCFNEPKEQHYITINNKCNKQTPLSITLRTRMKYKQFSINIDNIFSI